MNHFVALWTSVQRVYSRWAWKRTRAKIERLWVRVQSGQGLVEYALILVLVAIVVIGLLTIFGTSVKAVFQNIVDSLG